KGIMMQGMGSEDSFNLLMNKDIATNMNAVSNAWHNFLIALAGPDGKVAIDMLKNLTAVLNGMTSAVRSVSPDTLWMAMDGVAALGAALVVIAGAAVIGVAAVPALIAGVVAGIAALIALNWQKVVELFNGIKNAISSFIDWLSSIGDKVKKFLSSPAP